MTFRGFPFARIFDRITYQFYNGGLVTHMKTKTTPWQRHHRLQKTRWIFAFCLFAVLGIFSAGTQGYAQDSADSGTVSALDPVQPATPANEAQPGPVVVDESAVKTALPAATAPVPTPPDVVLKQVEPANPPITPLPQADSGDVAGTNVMGSTGAPQKHSGTYYDADALVPDSELAGAGVTGPRKVDPAYEPGAKFVVVERGGKATSYEAQYVAGTRALKLERYAAAMEIFEKLYKRNSKDTRVLMGLAIAQQGAGFTESAARTYEELLEIQPHNADATVNLMGIMRTQYPSVTLRKLAELREKYPTNAGIPAQMALISGETGEYQDALKYFEVAASMEPQNPSHIYNMAIVYDKKGEVKNAIRSYERALLLDAQRLTKGETIPREQIYDRLVVLRRKA